ncbi:MAG: glycosyltransferase family 2 protein [Candidatus Bathyarchaeota archaeon]|nr:glycosyltransferase family 2 protein [Candidatus Bathyarchaeota archaeon]
MAFLTPKNDRLASLHIYVFLSIPFLLAALSWFSFPILANWLSTSLFGYMPLYEPVGWLWYTVVILYYSWFTFLAIGVGGLLAVGAWLSQRWAKRKQMDFYPMVSFVVPAFNEEKHLPKCIDSLFKCGERYPGLVEIIIVDDGSGDNSYEIAFASINLNRRRSPGIKGRVVRHTANLGKVEALRSGCNRALGQVVAVVDADSWWREDTLQNLIEYMSANGKAAVTGYVHPSDSSSEGNPYAVLQQLEYSQGLGVFRCAQALGNSVLVVPGAIGLYEANILRNILNNKTMKSVTEDFEITLVMQEQGYEVGYMNAARCGTTAPESFSSFWDQRSRWFVGWLHNTLQIHRGILLSRRWISLLLWYCLIVEYAGAFVELAAITSFPFLFWFAPDRILFVLNLLWFGFYTLAIGMVSQLIALRFAYGKHTSRSLLCYTPFYAILRFINLWIRGISVVRYVLGYRGNWERKRIRTARESAF